MTSEREADDAVEGLVARLRFLSSHAVGTLHGEAMDGAADMLESITARVAEMEAAVDAEREAQARKTLAGRERPSVLVHRLPKAVRCN